MVCYSTQAETLVFDAENYFVSYEGLREQRSPSLTSGAGQIWLVLGM